jgi:hypothetical protein
VPGPQGPQGPQGASGTGTGNVNGPASSTNNNIAVFNGTSGTLIKDGGVAIAALAPLASPVFTGDPQAPTPATADSDTSIATTAFVKAQGYATNAALPAPATAIPLIESGTGAVGTATKYAREDHVHPIAAGGGSTVYMADTPPVGVPDKSLWIETDTGLMFSRYNDGTSTQWVMVPGGISGSAVRFDIAQTLTANQQAQARSNIALMKKNYVVNGAMMMSQENGAAQGTTNSYYPVDQFLTAISSGTTPTLSQVAKVTPAGSPNRIRITASLVHASVAASDVFILMQNIEGLRAADLKAGSASAKTVTLQFGVWAPAGTYCVAIRNTANNRSYVAEFTIAAGESYTDVVKSVVIPLDQIGTWPIDNTAGLVISWTLMAGSNFQAAPGSWQAGNLVATANQLNFMGTLNNTFELFDVGLYEGATAPPFMVPDYASELMACMRYWEKTLVVTCAIANVGPTHSLLAVKRAAPALTLVSVSSGTGAAYAMVGDQNGVRFWQTAAHSVLATATLTFNARL